MVTSISFYLGRHCPAKLFALHWKAILRVSGNLSAQSLLAQRCPRPQPYIERLVWSIVENRDTQLLKFRSGDLDISEPMRPEDFLY